MHCASLITRGPPWLESKDRMQQTVDENGPTGKSEVERFRPCMNPLLDQVGYKEKKDLFKSAVAIKDEQTLPVEYVECQISRSNIINYYLGTGAPSQQSLRDASCAPPRNA